MNYSLRKTNILAILEEQSHANVRELALKLSVSEISIRRDLDQLNKEGLIMRTHGGAMHKAGKEVAFDEKSSQAYETKMKIAEEASKLIEDDMVVMIDCGSTTYMMHHFIKNKSFKLITNSLPLINSLMHTDIQLNFIGGEIDPERKASHGMVAVKHVEMYRADLAFIGVDGLSIRSGLTAHSEKEAELSQALIQNAAKTILLADSRKFEKESYLPFAQLNQISKIITENGLDTLLKLRYESETELQLV